MSDAGEWIEWNGYSEETLSPPVERDDYVDLRTRGGKEFRTQIGSALDWDHCDDDWDIVAYRVVKP